MPPQSIMDLLDTAGQNLSQRKDIFYKIGQEYLLPLKDRSLQIAVCDIWNYLCKKPDNWISGLLVPDYYRQNKIEAVPKDIWYTIKEYMMWSVLYPDHADENVIQNEKGFFASKVNTSVRITNQDTTKDVYKSELGKRVLTKVKLSPDIKIKSGFTVGQKSDIIIACLVGLLPEPTYKKSAKPEKTAKSPAKKSMKKNKP